MRGALGRFESESIVRCELKTMFSAMRPTITRKMKPRAKNLIQENGFFSPSSGGGGLIREAPNINTQLLFFFFFNSKGHEYCHS